MRLYEDMRRSVAVGRLLSRLLLGIVALASLMCCLFLSNQLWKRQVHDLRWQTRAIEKLARSATGGKSLLTPRRLSSPAEMRLLRHALGSAREALLEEAPGQTLAELAPLARQLAPVLSFFRRRAITSGADGNWRGPSWDAGIAMHEVPEMMVLSLAQAFPSCGSGGRRTLEEALLVAAMYDSRPDGGLGMDRAGVERALDAAARSCTDTEQNAPVAGSLSATQALCSSWTALPDRGVRLLADLAQQEIRRFDGHPSLSEVRTYCALSVVPAQMDCLRSVSGADIPTLSASLDCLTTNGPTRSGPEVCAWLADDSAKRLARRVRSSLIREAALRARSTCGWTRLGATG